MREGDIAVFSPLCFSDLNQPSVAINIFNAQSSDFAYAQAGRIGNHENGPMFD
jgi:hypothetical protein